MKIIFTVYFLYFIVNCFGQLSMLNDEFTNPCSISDWFNITEKEGWTAEHLDTFDVSITFDGALMLKPHTSSWYQNYRGAYLFKEVSGDFVFTSEVTALNEDGNAINPTSNYSLAGLMVRDSTTNKTGQAGFQTGEEDYVFLSLGRGNSGNSWQFEVKNTDNAVSNLEIDNISSNNVIIRIVRHGNAIVVLHNINGNGWNFHRRFNRSDFPETIQVGFVTYTDWNNVQALGFNTSNDNVLNSSYNNSTNWDPDLIGRYDYARFDSVDMPSPFQNANLLTLDTSTIRQIFDYESVPTTTYNHKLWLGRISSDWTDQNNWTGGIVPVVGDSIMVQDCSCSVVNAPALPAGITSITSLLIEEGASLEIPVGSELQIDLSNAGASFENLGTIHNYGTIIITNTSGKKVVTKSNIYNYAGAILTVEE